MDVRTDNLLQEHLGVVNKKFMKGVAVLQIPGDPQTNHIEIGSLYVPEKTQPTCHICHQRGHMRADCPQRNASKICRFCNQNGHVKRECPSYTCDNCGEQGHMWKACPVPKTRKERTCANCGQSGHHLNNCDQPCGNCGDAEHRVDLCSTGPSARFEAAAEAAQAKARTKMPEANGEAMQGADDKPKQEEAASEADVEMTEPLDIYSVSSKEELSVRLETEVIAQHITSCSLRFQASYQVDEGGDKLKHTTATVRFTAANIKDSNITVEVVDPASPVLKQLLANDTLSQFSSLASGSTPLETLALHHISMTVCNTTLLGEYFYANGDFGPFTPNIYRARDLLQDNREVVVHFFTVGGGWIEGFLGEARDSIQAQRSSDPLLDWFPSRKFNVQKGMELKPEQRPSYKAPVRSQFDSNTEFLTVQFYAALANAESDSKNPRIETTLRAIKFPGGNDRVYLGVLQRVPELSLRPDSIVSVSFFGEDADIGDDWLLRIISENPVISGCDVAGFLFRKRQGKTAFVDSPAEFHGRALDCQDYSTAADLSNAIFHARGTVCHVREHVPRVSMNREINTLRYMSQKEHLYTHEMRLFLANDLRAFDKYNLFALEEAKFGEERVVAARDAATATLSDEQRAVFNGFKEMTAGIKLIQGPGGTGKSKILTSVIEYFYNLYSHDNEGGRVNVLSSLNQQLDDSAKKTFKRLMDAYQNRGCTGKYPIVVRRHMRATESKVYRKDAKEKRNAEGIQTFAPYFHDDTDDVDGDGELAALGMADFVRKTWADSNATGFDTRLKVFDLSEGSWALRLAGVPDGDGKMHPIAKPDKYSEFRSHLERFSRGEVTTPDDKMNLTLAANKVMADLAAITDATFMTPDVASQARSYGIVGSPRVVLHDEAGKMTEVGALASFVWSKFERKESKAKQTDTEDKETNVEDKDTNVMQTDTQDKETNVEDKDTNVMQTDVEVKETNVEDKDTNVMQTDTHDKEMPPRVVTPSILSGDIQQLNPITGRGPKGPFHEQRAVSLFARLLKCGADACWLWEQYRYVESIAALINFIMSDDGRIRTGPDVAARPIVEQAATVIQKVLDVKMPLAFVATGGEERKNMVTMSRYNGENANRCIWMLLSLLDQGIPPNTIGIGVFYKAQLSLYIAALYSLEAWCIDQPEDSKFHQLAESIHEVKCFTIDGIQGGEVEILLLDYSNTDGLGFIGDTARVLLAVTRARVGLVCFGNPAAIESSYEGHQKKGYQRTAFNRMIQWFKKNKLYINLENKNHRERATEMNSPMEITDIVDRIHTPREHTTELYNYSLDSAHNIGGVRFGRVGDGNGGSEDAGGTSSWNDNKATDGIEAWGGGGGDNAAIDAWDGGGGGGDNSASDVWGGGGDNAATMKDIVAHDSDDGTASSYSGRSSMYNDDGGINDADIYGLEN